MSYPQKVALPFSVLDQPRPRPPLRKSKRQRAEGALISHLAAQTTALRSASP